MCRETFQYGMQEFHVDLEQAAQPDNDEKYFQQTEMQCAQQYRHNDYLNLDIIFKWFLCLPLSQYKRLTELTNFWWSWKITSISPV